MGKKKVEEKVRCNDPNCNSEDVIKAGWNWRNRKKDVQRYRCRKCGKIFVPPIKSVDKNNGGTNAE